MIPRTIGFYGCFADRSEQNHAVDKQLSCHSFSHAPSACIIQAWARIDNREELKKQLPVDLITITNQNDTLGDIALILACYLHWGDECVEKLIGDFSFAIEDQRQHRVLLCRDHLGVKPLYYYETPEQNKLYYATNAQLLELALTSDDHSLKDNPFNQYSESWLAGFMMDRPDWQETPFVGVKKVLPAHYIIKEAGKKAQLKQYFTFSRESNLVLSSSTDYIEAYRELLFEAIKCRVDMNGPIASELSGGLDSSTVTAYAARAMNNPGHNLHCMGMALGQFNAEAMAAVANMTPCAMTHFITPTQQHALSQEDAWLRNGGIPIEHANSISHYPFYEACNKLNISVLLSGFGGDEFVTNAGPTVLVELWRQRQWRDFYERQRGAWFSKPLHTLRWLYLYYRHNNHSVTARILQNAAKEEWRWLPFTNAAVKNLELEEPFFSPPQYDGGQITQNDFSLNNRWSPMMTARLENCTQVAASFGIDYRWPLLDIRLLKLFLSIPAREKLGPGLTGRYLHRSAAAPFLPPHIAWGPKELVEPHWSIRLMLSEKRYTKLVSKRDALPLTKAPKHYLKLQQQIRNNVESRAKSPSNLPKNNTVMAADIQHHTHPALETIIDTEKLSRLENDNVITRKILHQFNTLNNWLYHRDKTT